MRKCADWSKPPNYFTAQLFSPKAAYPRTQQSSPDYSRTAWLAPYRTHDPSLSSSGAKPNHSVTAANPTPARMGG